MATPDDPRKKLSELAAAVAALVKMERRISSRRLFPPTIPFELGDWFVTAVDAYLTNKESDFGKALGLKRGRGRPTSSLTSLNYKRSKEIYLQQAFNKDNALSWKALGEKYEAGPRDLQRELKRYTPDIEAEISGWLKNRLDQVEARLERIVATRLRKRLSGNK